MAKWQNIHVDTLELSARTRHVFSNNGIYLLGTIAAMTDWELLRLDNFGRKSLNEIRQIITDLSGEAGLTSVHNIYEKLAHAKTRAEMLRVQLAFIDKSIADMEAVING